MEGIKKFYHYYGLMSMTIEGYLQKSPLKYIAVIIVFQVAFYTLTYPTTWVSGITMVMAIGATLGYMLNRAEFKNYLLVPVKKSYRISGIFLFAIVNIILFYLVGSMAGFILLLVLSGGHINPQSTEVYALVKITSISFLVAIGVISGSFINNRIVRYIVLSLIFVSGFFISRIV